MAIVGTSKSTTDYATSGKQDTQSASLASIDAKVSTSANQAIGNASLASIDAGIPAALGQTTMANSMPVVLPSNQIVPVRPQNPSTIVYEDFNVANGGVARNAAVGTTFTNLYSKSGSGLFYGFNVALETSTIWFLRLVIDGNEIFTSSGISVDDIEGGNLYNHGDGDQEFLGLTFQGANSIRWKAPNGWPIPITTSVAVLGKVTSSTKKMLAGYALRST